MASSPEALYPATIPGPSRGRRVAARLKGIASNHANALWSLVGNFGYAFCQWGMLVALAKVGNAEMLGRFALGLAITAPVMVLSMMQLRALQATDHAPGYRLGTYMRLRLWCCTLAVLVMGAIAAWYGTEDRSTGVVVFILGIAKAIEAISDIFQGELQRREAIAPLAGTMLLKGVLSVTTLIGGMLWGGSLEAGCAALVIGWCVTLVAVDLPLNRWITRHDDPFVKELPERTPEESARLRTLFWQGLPLGLIAMLISLNATIPRYFLDEVAGPAGVGIFSGLAYFIIASNQVAAALGMSSSARLGRLVAAEDWASFRRTMSRLKLVGVGFGLVVMAGVVLLGKDILQAFYRPEFGDHHLDFCVLMTAAFATSLSFFLNWGVVALRGMKSQFWILLGLLPLSIGLCAWLVPAYGIHGACWATVVISFSQMAATWMVLEHLLRRAARPKPAAAESYDFPKERCA